MNRFVTILLAGLLSATALLTAGCNNNPGADDKPTVAVSVLPQEYFVSRIAGDLFNINVMIPPGASPATYEPTPAQLTSLSKTSLYLKMGYTGFEMAWIDKLASANKAMTIMNTSEGVDLITEATVHGEAVLHSEVSMHEGGTMHAEEGTMHGADDDHTYEEGKDHLEEEHQMDQQDHVEGDDPMHQHDAAGTHGHHHGGIDPHTWLSPKNVKIIAKNIHDALASEYPDHKQTFSENIAVFLAELDSLDKGISNELTDLSSRSFFTYHPSLSYFARDYNLVQHPLELGGKTPSAAHLKKLIDKGKQEQIGVVFLQMQFDQKNAEVLAKEIDAEIVQINPLDPEWYAQMLFIAEKLKENLQ